MTRSSADRLASRSSRERLVLRPSTESLRQSPQHLLSSSTSTLSPPATQPQHLSSTTIPITTTTTGGARVITTQLTSDEATLIASMRRKRAAMAKLPSTEFLVPAPALGPASSRRTSVNKAAAIDAASFSTHEPQHDDAFERGLRRLGKRDRITRLTPPAIPARTSSVRATEMAGMFAPPTPLSQQEAWKGKERVSGMYDGSSSVGGSKNRDSVGAGEAWRGSGVYVPVGAEVIDERRRSSTTRGERDSIVRRSGAKDVLMAWDGLGGSARGSVRGSVFGARDGMFV